MYISPCLFELALHKGCSLYPQIVYPQIIAYRAKQKKKSQQFPYESSTSAGINCLILPCSVGHSETSRKFVYDRYRVMDYEFELFHINDKDIN